MSKLTYKKYMTESFLYEADDDDRYVHVGGGVYKEKDGKGQPLPNSPKYLKKDNGGFEMVDDDDPRLKKGDDKEKKKPVSIDIDASGGFDPEKPDDEPSDMDTERPDDEPEDEPKGELKGESIKTINGKKYKAIKESVNKRVTVKEVKSWLKGLEEFRYRKIPGVDVRRITSFVNNGLSETDLPKSLQKKWESAKYSKEKGLADRFMKERINKKLTQNESKHPIKERYDRLFKNKVVL